MPEQTNPVLDFLTTRRSTPPKMLAGPAPDRAALETLLLLAARVPDHGALVPFRFLVLAEAALRRIGDAIVWTGTETGLPEDQIGKARAVYATSPLAIAVIASPKPSAKIPEVEQLHSAGSACLQLLNAAQAAGWAAGWVTGWAAHDRRFLPKLLDLADAESIVGLVHIGTAAPQADRPRPDMIAITRWLDA